VGPANRNGRSKGTSGEHRMVRRKGIGAQSWRAATVLALRVMAPRDEVMVLHRHRFNELIELVVHRVTDEARVQHVPVAIRVPIGDRYGARFGDDSDSR
jgi:hypothetical protein